MSLDFLYGLIAGGIVSTAGFLFILYCVGVALAGQDDYALKVDMKAEAARLALELERNR